MEHGRGPEAGGGLMAATEVAPLRGLTTDELLDSLRRLNAAGGPDDIQQLIDEARLLVALELNRRSMAACRRRDQLAAVDLAAYRRRDECP